MAKRSEYRPPHSPAHGLSDQDSLYEGEKGLGNQLKVLSYIFSYLWPKENTAYQILVIAAMLALVASKLVALAIPILMGSIVNNLTPSANSSLNGVNAMVIVPVSMIILWGVTRISGPALQQLRDALFVRVGQHAQRVVAVQVFEHLHKLSLRFHLERRTGGVSRIIERGIKSIEFLLRFLIFSIFPTFFELILVCTYLTLKYDGRYALITALTVLSYVWFTFSITEWRVKIRRQMNKSDTEANTKAIDSLLNFETVKYFGNEKYEAERYDNAMESYQNAAVRSQFSLSAISIGQSLIFNAGVVLLLVMAGYDVVEGKLNVGDFIVVYGFLIQIYMPLNMLGFVYREIKQALVDMESMYRLLGIGPEVSDKEGAKPLIVSGAEIRFESVYFSYDPDRGILKNVSFVVPAGKKVAIVGPSGAGKSTISRILFRFYDVYSGRVLIDGQDITKVTQSSLREAIGIVPQDTVLFNDTIRYNIAYAKTDASDDEIQGAAKLAQIHTFIESLPQGYNTMVGERGLKLSGGEKQRVAIARTILKDPPILLLDEATSALDSKTESEIQDALREVSRQRTTLVIAHRLSTVTDADEILVLQAGCIAERGSHSELLSQKGIYAQMWTQQLESGSKPFESIGA